MASEEGVCQTDEVMSVLRIIQVVTNVAFAMVWTTVVPAGHWKNKIESYSNICCSYGPSRIKYVDSNISDQTQNFVRRSNIRDKAWLCDWEGI